MNVNELIELLQRIPESKRELTVRFRHDSGDYWGRQIAPEVGGFDYTDVVHSCYHEEFKVVNTEDEDEDENIEEAVTLYAEGDDEPN